MSSGNVPIVSPNVDSVILVQTDSNIPPESLLRRSSRIRHPPKYLEVYDHNLSSQSNIVTAHTISRYLSSSRLSNEHRIFTASLSQIPEP